MQLDQIDYPEETPLGLSRLLSSQLHMTISFHFDHPQHLDITARGLFDYGAQ